MLASFGLWIALVASDVDALACTPIPPAGAASIPRCADPRRDGTVHVRRDALRALSFDADGLAVVFMHDEFYYVNRAGKTVQALRFDNGADYFVEGLARNVRNGKIGFVDKHLVEIVPADFDFAFPFQRGVAVVCDGCRAVTEGGHDRIEGGTWGYIDRKGRAVVELVHTREALPPIDAAWKASKHAR